MENRARPTTEPRSIIPPAETEREIDLIELGYELLARLWYIVLAGVLGLVIAAIYTFAIAVPQYQATAKLYVLNSSDSVINLSDLQLGNYLASDYKEIFNAWEIHQMVRENLGVDYTYTKLKEMVAVSNPSDTRVLYITVTSPDAQEAADMANEYAKVVSNYVAVIMATDRPNTLSVAIKPTAPVSPQKARNLILGLVIGLVLAGGVVVVRFMLDDSVKSPDDVTKHTGMPILAIVPMLDEHGDKKGKGYYRGRGYYRGKDKNLYARSENE